MQKLVNIQILLEPDGNSKIWTPNLPIFAKKYILPHPLPPDILCKFGVSYLNEFASDFY